MNSLSKLVKPSQLFSNNNVLLRTFSTQAPLNRVQQSSFGTNKVLTDAQRTVMKEDPVLNQFVNLVMRDGKKTKAQTIIGEAFTQIRLRTNTDPYLVFTSAIEKTRPLMHYTTQKVSSKVTIIPYPLNLKQSRRQAMKWILQYSEKRNQRSFGERLANELLSIINNNSTVLAKKNELHKLVLANRTNALQKGL
ncbi:ribosomal protein S7 [Conidiobolus coronatus NRRL 28638]|uniref:Ribosomal protein S7 n=1 Tax=Conidiobolus coronatus (strain ATCC 28846 / CBS 209.66 / NRRL 28638) TaxID=796925 RepID=A0A137NQ94_CONC2|nr:ribosomal protein S7 [Conidiobolus coronatus NRRL 28638]|eukprot:KXN64922.1 ribosomal protein S7 [Conidiobolus coronatus NRRL 28638]